MFWLNAGDAGSIRTSATYKPGATETLGASVGAGALVAGTGVAVAGIAVGGATVGRTGVAVGGTAVAVGGTGVAVGGTRVAVGTSTALEDAGTGGNGVGVGVEHATMRVSTIASAITSNRFFCITGSPFFRNSFCR